MYFRNNFYRKFYLYIHTNKRLSTWTHLATAFNAPPAKQFNITKNETGLFNIPELKKPTGFYLLQENIVNKTDELINEALSSKRKRKMVEIFDELSDSLCKVADLSEFVRLAHPNSKYSQAAGDACITISGIVEKLNTNKELYKALDHVIKKNDIVETTEIDNHVGKLFLFDFEQSGIHLEESQRQKVVRLNDYILLLGQKFMDGAIQPRSIIMSALPSSIRTYFPIDGENILVSGLYTDSANSLAREAAYRLFLYPDNQQEELLSNLIKSRNELAQICEFETYAHRTLKSSTVQHPNVVNEFLIDLSAQLKSRSQKDFNIMEKMKKSDSTIGNTKLAAWDTPFYTAQVKRKWLNGPSENFNPYFSLGCCMEGLNNLMNSLYGISFKNTEMEPGECWAYGVYKLSVTHETEGLLGYIYCDFFERSGKPNQDCHFTIQGGRRLPNGSYQIPIVVVMLNFRQNHWPSLLMPSMVDNLFHEMGHAMHSMLARTEYQHVTGTRCSTDFAEVPSVLMEYFASDPRVVRTYAKHYRTNEPMPDEMLQRLCASKHIFAASETELQVFYSALDQKYHGNLSEHGSTTTETLKRVQENFYSLPYVDNTAWQLRFSHLVGYGAKYYSYLISRAIASWIWQTYFQENPFSRDAGEKFRRECLAHGGGVPSKNLIENFLNKDITAKNLSQCLIKEIDKNNLKTQEMSKLLKIPYDDI